MSPSLFTETQLWFVPTQRTPPLQQSHPITWQPISIPTCTRCTPPTRPALPLRHTPTQLPISLLLLTPPPCLTHTFCLPLCSQPWPLLQHLSTLDSTLREVWVTLLCPTSSSTYRCASCVLQSCTVEKSSVFVFLPSLKKS